MAEEYQQSQLHRRHDAEEEGEKREFYDESKSTRASAFVDGDELLIYIINVPPLNLTPGFAPGSVTASVGDEVAAFEGPKYSGLVGFEEKKPNKDDTSDDDVGVEGKFEATDRRLFGNFMGIKEEEMKKVDEEEANEVITEFEKANVLKPEEKKVENDQKEEKKLRRSGSSTSSSSDEEEEGEDGEKKKKKKGLKEKIKEMVSGGDDEKEKFENPENNMLEKEVEAPYQKPAEAAYEEPSADLANETINTENYPLTTHTQDPEQKDKKGILEKIKEKIPGYNTKAA